MTGFLERDENYEPAVLPSPAELLHWGDLHAPPEEKRPSVIADESDGFARFVPQRRKGRTVAAIAITVVAGSLGAWGLGTLNMGDGVSGFSAYVKGAILIAAVAGVLVGTWKWANRRRFGGPRFG